MDKIRLKYDFAVWLADYNRQQNTTWRPTNAPDKLIELFLKSQHKHFYSEGKSK